MYFFCSVCIKSNLLKSALLLIPCDAQHDVKSKSRIYSVAHGKDASFTMSHKIYQSLLDVLAKPVRNQGEIEGFKEIENMNRIKRQNWSLRCTESCTKSTSNSSNTR